MLSNNSRFLSKKSRSILSAIALSLFFIPAALFPVVPAAPGFSTLSESIDSVSIFALELNRTIERLISFNADLAEMQIEPELAGFLAQQEGDVNPVDRLNTMPFLSLDESSNAMLLLDEFFSNDLERIERGLMIRSLPISSPVSGTITSGFGMRNHPILGGRRAHKGLDIAAPTGTEIFAPGRGTVVFSGRKNGYGNTVIVDHGYGYTTLYGHCSKLLVEEGATVSRGDVIALVGSTGRSTGPHLHYEVRINGEHMNPGAFIYYDRSDDRILAAIAEWYTTV